MFRLPWICFFGACLFLGMSMDALCQVGKYKFRHLTTENGLPTPRVEYIMKDSRGFMWFGTGLGLCRYDGYNFKVYNYDPEDSASMTQSTMKTNIIEDKKGYLWVGNYCGLNRFDPVTEKVKRYVHDTDDPTTLTNNFVVSLGMDRSGILWVGMTSGGGLCRYNEDRDNFTRFVDKKFGKSNIYAIHEDKTGILWIGTANGLFQFDRKKEIFIPIEPEPHLPGNFIPDYRAIREDGKGNLWFVTKKAILTIMREEGGSVSLKALLGKEKQLEGCEAKDILAEPIEGGYLIWLTACHLSQLNTASMNFRIFRHEPDDPESPGQGAFNLFKDEAGTLWISSRRSGINILDKDSYHIADHHDFFKKYNCNATIFFEHSDGSFWVGTHSDGIMHFDPEWNLLKWYRELYLDRAGKNRTGIIWTMMEDHDSRL